jgi:DUF4097 and DUF4098 domain-containing protein YvlB
MRLRYGIFLLGAVALAQDTGNRVTFQFADPSRPGVLQGSLMNGCFAVEGYEGRDVVVESRRGASVQNRHAPKAAEGLRRIDPSGIGVTVEVDNNTAHIRGTNVEGELTIRVPRATSLKLSCMNGGDLTVKGVAGDLELNSQNSNVIATGITGSVVAHSLNGKVAVSLDRVTPDKPMSFSSLNGDVDVTLPPDTKATVRTKSDNGETFTDFDVVVQPTAPAVEDNRAKGGRYRVKSDRTLVGNINGGGPDLTLKTLNGSIYLRKKK